LAGTSAGVFVGTYSTGYGELVSRAVEDAQAFLVTSNAGSVASGRIAYALGLEGPAVTVDTACSSSLVSIHSAAQALRSGECGLALVGGASIMADANLFVGFSHQGGLSADGRCKPFADAADGTGFSEGVGMLVMERLSDARRNGHQVLAVVKGSAVNQDGASNGLTAPNGPSQQRVIRQALAVAGLSSGVVDAVEAHGTGTTLGDPIEAHALLATYGQGRDEPLWLGSLKSNIGHTQAAAGVAGVIKMVEAMRHGVLPRTLHVDEPSRHVDWEAGQVRLLTEAVSWPETGHPRRVGVSGFGVSGTNAHVILEQAPDTDAGDAVDTTAPEIGVVPWVLSGKSGGAVREQAARLVDCVVADSGLRPVDVGWSLLSSRAVFDHRVVITGSGRDELLAGARAVAAGEPGVWVAEGTVRADNKVVFVFPGQGSQWVGMAQGLLESSAVFAESMAQCSRALGSFVDWSLLDVLDDPVALERVGVVQPVLWAVMVSLAAVWRSYGVEPAAVVGHSQGEIAAACVAGGLSLSDGARVVALRSKAIAESLAGLGGMVAVPLPVDKVRELIAGLSQGLSVAAVNGPGSVVVSGDSVAVEQLLERCVSEGVRARRIPVDYASHSALVEQIEDRLLDDLAPVSPRSALVPVYSTVTGQVMDTAEWDAGYWYRNLRETVQFEQAVGSLAGDGHTVLVEVSPHPVLTAAVQDTLDGQPSSGGQVFGTLRRGEGGQQRMLAALAQAYVCGIAVDWQPVFEGAGAVRVGLPTYAFQRRRFWPSAAAAVGDVTAAGLVPAEHPLLGAMVSLPDSGGVMFTSRLSLRTHPWLADHAVRDVVVFPGTGFVEWAIRAGDAVGCGRVSELVLEVPLIVPVHGGCQVQVVVGQQPHGSDYTVAIYARGDTDQEWTRHVTGVLSASDVVDEPEVWGQVWPPAGATLLDIAGHYEMIADTGFRYGPVFQGLQQAWQHGEQVFAEIVLPETEREDAGSFGIHPALLDAVLHSSFFAGLEPAEFGRLPFSFTGVTLHASGATQVRACLTRTGPDEVSLVAVDSSGAPVVSIESLALRPLTPGSLTAGTGQNPLLTLSWAETPTPTADIDVSRWAVVGTPGEPGVEYPDMRAMAAAVDLDPSTVLLLVPHRPGPDQVVDAVHDVTLDVLDQVQCWLGDDRFTDSRLVVLTRGAIAIDGTESVTDLAAAAVWGLIRTAQTENPGRITLLDVPPHTTVDTQALARATAADEPQIAIRDGAIHTARLTRIATGLTPPATPWRLDTTQEGTLDNLSLLPCPEAAEPLTDGQIRIQIRVSGLNFRDVLNALGMYPGEAGPLGWEAAGVVLETGPGVNGLRVGDRVMGMVSGAFGPVAVVDSRLVAQIPPTMTFAEAASIPIVFLTAYYGLVDLAQVRSGESLLVHAGAGGVGMAAIQLARHFGVEVYATASERKWNVLHSMGVSEDRVASSRTLEFEQRIRAATDGRGVDVVLNSLAGEFVDASLNLLSPGGRFLEMGKTDIRPADVVQAEHPAVTYQAYELIEAGPDRIQDMLTHLVELFQDGTLRPLPITSWDVRQAPEAFRFMSQAKHIGKLVLTMPGVPDAQGTVVITGGTGGLGSCVARHLVVEHGVRHLLLASRRGEQADGASQLVDELSALGAAVTVAACDVTDRESLAQLLSGVPAEHPVTGVVHTAGILDDGVIGSLTPQQVHLALAPKADAAWHLHELTAGMDLSMFVVFSSMAGIIGGAGQGNYAAGNAFLDALIQQRRHAGLPGVSMAWGAWTQQVGLTGTLSDVDMRRMARLGMPPLSVQQGLELFDRAVRSDQGTLALTRVDVAAVRALREIPPMWQILAGGTGRRVISDQQSTPDSLAQRMAGLSVQERERVLMDLVRGNAAAVLGHASGEQVNSDQPFKEMGFDSLTAVELRNRLHAATGQSLPATLVFDYPTTTRLAGFLAGLFGDIGADDPAESVKAAVMSDVERLAESLSGGTIADNVRLTVVNRLRLLLADLSEAGNSGEPAQSIEDWETPEEIFQFIDDSYGLPAEGGQ
jgi:acyl transferase domain-containing protein/NADPH-dependent curcumin reductase CurA